MRVADFNFDLPAELIAQHPPAERGASRMLVVDRSTGVFQDDQFIHIPSLLKAGDLLVMNDSRVIPARLYGTRLARAAASDAHIEALLAAQVGAWDWQALVKPGKKIIVGDRLEFSRSKAGPILKATVIDRGEAGQRTLRFEPDSEFWTKLDHIGHIPLPPYIHRAEGASSEDRQRYQTVYANEPGSAAAPTAGLHFTPELIAQLQDQGVQIAKVTLHVGLGTFAPLKVEDLTEVRLHEEHYTLPEETAQAINQAKAQGRRIVCVGTTTVRTLEHCMRQADEGLLKGHSGSTHIFLSPGAQFLATNALITNFHLPQSSLLMLVSAFAGRENILAAYQHAIQSRYRFFSYGDCMFIG